MSADDRKGKTYLGDTYLGDSVYASFDGFMMKLETNNGMGADNEIYLEDQVFLAFLEFVGRHWSKEKIIEHWKSSGVGVDL